MPAAYTTLTLTGGAATRNLVDGTNYSLVADGWSPSVPGLRRSALAGSGPYDDATEEILINVRGSTGPIAHANLLALADDLDQARRWWLGEQIGPILLNIQPQGSDLVAALSVPIWGGDVPLGLPASYNDLLMVYEIGPVTLRFKRPGQWFGATQSPSATAAQTHPNIFSVTFASDVGNKLLPLDLSFDGFTGSANASGVDLGSEAYLLVASHSDKLRKFEAESVTAAVPGSGTFNTAADSGASNGNIRRLAPISAGDYTLTATITGPIFPATKCLLVCVAVVKNNSATISYEAKASWFYSGVEYASIKHSPVQVIDLSTTDPRVIVFDPVYWDNANSPDRLRLTFTPSATAAIGNQLDVDVFVAMQTVNPTDRVLQLMNINKYPPGISTVLNFESSVLTRPLPLIQNHAVLVSFYAGYRGDNYLLTTGDRVACCLVGTTGDQWRVLNGRLGSSPTAVSSALTATRRLAYLVPQ